MSNLLKKVWESVSNRSSNSSRNLSYTAAGSVSGSGSAHPHHVSESNQIITNSTGEFDRIPIDVLMQILKLLPPYEVAKLTAVCKSWKLIVSDNRLWVYYLQNQHVHWDSIFFSEVNLRSGYPLQTYPCQMQSFMHIYGQRAQVPGAIIIDGGSGYCKFGWSKFDSPSGRSATFL